MNSGYVIGGSMKTFLCWLISRSPKTILFIEVLVILFLNEKHIVISDVLSDKSVMFKFLLSASILSIIVSLLIMIYTYKNFEEVISQQFKYKSSNVEKFDYRLKYSWDRFKVTFIICVLATYIIGILNYKA